MSAGPLIEVVDDLATAAGRAFLALPQTIYAADPCWAPASETVVAERVADAAAGLIGLHAVVATVAGRPAARAAAILEPVAVDPDGRREGWIGLVECAPGPDATAAGLTVLAHCRSWLTAQGAERVVGPRVDGLVAGLLVDGFDQPQVVLTTHNPPTYPALWHAAGARPVTSMLSYRFSRERVPHFPTRTTPGIRVRAADPADLPGEIARVHAFQAEVFRGGAGHLPRSPEATERLARRLLPLLDPDLVLLAEDRAGQVVGILVCLPDAWQPRATGQVPDRARLVSIGVRAGWRRTGVALAMGAELADRLLVRGYQHLEGSWVLGPNRAPQLLAGALQARPSRRFELLAW
ncbi:MAG: GNAT family N-acetyltransferase [Nitriliruptoraceae bacterium]